MAALLDDASFFIGDKPQTLCDWVKNFRLKKSQMKRKYRHGSNLRVCAMLTTALNNAEDELKRKQQERFNKWADMQSKMGYYNYTSNPSNNSYYNYNNSSCASEVNRSSTNSYSYYNNNSIENSDDDDLQKQHRDNINELWKSELSGLDQFMKNMSSSCSVNN